jgi:hypothetical protein
MHSLGGDSILLPGLSNRITTLRLRALSLWYSSFDKRWARFLLIAGRPS